jgi:hypothetical protein
VHIGVTEVEDLPPASSQKKKYRRPLPSGAPPHSGAKTSLLSSKHRRLGNSDFDKGESIMSIIRKTLAAAVVVATFGAVVAASTAPASAKPFGFGFGHGHGFGLLGGGLLLGAAVAATAPRYGYDCYIAHQQVYDDYGNYVGVRRVRVCN